MNDIKNSELLENTPLYYSYLSTFLHEHPSIETIIEEKANYLRGHYNSFIEINYMIEPELHSLLHEQKQLKKELQNQHNAVYYFVIYFFKKQIIIVHPKNIKYISLKDFWFRSIEQNLQLIHDYICDQHKKSITKIPNSSVKNENSSIISDLNSKDLIIHGTPRHNRWMKRTKEGMANNESRKNYFESMQNQIDESTGNQILVQWLIKNYENNVEFIQKHYPNQYNYIMKKKLLKK